MRWLWILPFVLMYLALYFVQQRVRLEFKPGARVRVLGGLFGNLKTGTLIAPKRRLGRPGWIVKLDNQSGREALFDQSRLHPYVAGSEKWLRSGQHVQILGGWIIGKTGVLIRPARLLLYPAWLVQLDEPFGRWKRTRVATRILIPIP